MKIRDRRARDFITNNFGLKILSLAAAIVLFSLVRGAEDAQRSVFVDVVALLPLPQSGQMLVSELPDQVRLTLRGSRSQLNTIRPDSIPPVQIDLTDTHLHYYYFADDEFDVPAGIAISQVAPASISLQWAERDERTLPVQPQLRGTPAEGLALGEPARADPAEVTIVGPADELRDLRAIRTEPIELSRLEAGVHQLRARLEPPPPYTRYQQDGPTRVRVEVVRDLAERSLPGLPVQVEGGEVSSVRPAMISVTLRGVPGEVDLVDPASVTPYVDVSSSGAGPAVLPIALRGLPAGIEIVRVEPANVELVVRESGEPAQE